MVFETSFELISGHYVTQISKSLCGGTVLKFQSWKLKSLQEETDFDFQFDSKMLSDKLVLVESIRARLCMKSDDFGPFLAPPPHIRCFDSAPSILESDLAEPPSPKIWWHQWTALQYSLIEVSASFSQFENYNQFIEPCIQKKFFQRE